MTLLRPESLHDILGVAGRMHNLHIPSPPWKPSVFANQTWKSLRRPVEGYGEPASMQVSMRFDDNCKNGHMDFSITADVLGSKPSRDPYLAGGCLHDEIAQVFPELAPLIKWHLVSTDGPMHYVGNTVYLAGDKDHNGRRKGEVSSWSEGYLFGNSPIFHSVRTSLRKFIDERLAGDGQFQICSFAHRSAGKPHEYQYPPSWTLVGYGESWGDCPWLNEEEARRFCEALNTVAVTPCKIPTAYSEGKERDLDAARSVACWPEATDEELMQDGLEAKLRERLPQLLKDFRSDMERIGFLYERPQGEAA